MQYFAPNDTKFCTILFSSVNTDYHKRMHFKAASCSSLPPGPVEDAFGRLTFALLGKDRHCSSPPDSLHSNAPGATYHVLRDGNNVFLAFDPQCAPVYLVHLHGTPVLSRDITCSKGYRPQVSWIFLRVPSYLVSSERKLIVLAMTTTSFASETSKVLSLLRVPLDICGINDPLLTCVTQAALTMANSAPGETSSHDTPTPQATTNTPPEPPLPHSHPKSQ